MGAEQHCCQASRSQLAPLPTELTAGGSQQLPISPTVHPHVDFCAEEGNEKENWESGMASFAGCRLH